MKKTSVSDILNLHQYLVIIIATWDIIGIMGMSLGAFRWFHFPYLLFLDEWHFLWASVGIACGLILSQIILDSFSYLNLSRLMLAESDQQLSLEFKQFLIKMIWGILGIILLEFVMILWELSSALRGLVNLGIGISCLWSSRFYWISLFQAD